VIIVLVNSRPCTDCRFSSRDAAHRDYSGFSLAAIREQVKFSDKPLDMLRLTQCC
jgi:hypothetical protein